MEFSIAPFVKATENKYTLNRRSDTNMAGRTKMNLPEIGELSLAELKALEKKVVKAIASHEVKQKKAALQTLESKAKELGFSLSELTGMEKLVVRKKAAKPGVPKYKNPADATQTWTGKGRRPEWVNAALDAGKSLDDLAI